eukprot:gene52294-24342_t
MQPAQQLVAEGAAAPCWEGAGVHVSDPALCPSAARASSRAGPPAPPFARPGGAPRRRGAPPALTFHRHLSLDRELLHRHLSLDRELLHRHLSLDRELLLLHRHLSLDRELLAAVADESLDFIYLDGAHDYANVKREMAAWWPKPAGRVAANQHGIVRAVHEWLAAQRGAPALRHTEEDFTRASLAADGLDYSLVITTNRNPSWFLFKPRRPQSRQWTEQRAAAYMAAHPQRAYCKT